MTIRALALAALALALPGRASAVVAYNYKVALVGSSSTIIVDTVAGALKVTAVITSTGTGVTQQGTWTVDTANRVPRTRTVSWSQTHTGPNWSVQLPGVVYSMTGTGLRFVNISASGFGTPGTWQAQIMGSPTGTIQSWNSNAALGGTLANTSAGLTFQANSGGVPPAPYVTFGLVSCSGCAIGSGVTATAYFIEY